MGEVFVYFSMRSEAILHFDKVYDRLRAGTRCSTRQKISATVCYGVNILLRSAGVCSHSAGVWHYQSAIGMMERERQGKGRGEGGKKEGGREKEGRRGVLY